MMKTTPKNKRIALLMKTIANYKSLSAEKQEELSSLFEETIENFRDLEGCSDIINDFLLEIKYGIN